jgi:hypothetical protein
MRRLLIRPGALGDTVVALPALEHLRAAYTEVWCPAAHVPLLRCADAAVALSATGLDLLEIPGQDAGRVRERLAAFDEIVSWYGAARPEFRAAVRGLPFVFHDALPGGGEHAVDYYLRQVGAAAGARPRIAVPRRAGGYAVIHPFSGSPRKSWPLENFRAVAAALAERMPVRWCAGPEEELPGATRFEDLFELATWLGNARVYIGNDSGPTHLAAAAGAPVVAIFQASDATVWAPRGPRVRVLERPGVADVVRSVAEAGGAEDEAQAAAVAGRGEVAVDGDGEHG